ncbi:MAG: hypothetical protein AAF999_09080 [Pseudomonadota bacterium]
MPEALELVHLPDGRVVNETGQDPAISRVTGYSRFQIAADLGQANDYSAVVVIKDQALPIVDDDKIIVGPRERTVVYADRFRGVSYVDVVDHLIRLKNAPPFGGKSELAIDGTSIWRLTVRVIEEAVANISHLDTRDQEHRSRASARSAGHDHSRGGTRRGWLRSRSHLQHVSREERRLGRSALGDQPRQVTS